MSRINRNWFLFATMLIMSLFAFGCWGEDENEVDPCTRDAQCPNSERCVEGVCTPVDDPSDGDEEDTRDCQTGEIDSCPCLGGTTGSRLCQQNGTWGSCNCPAPPDGDATDGDTADGDKADGDFTDGDAIDGDHTDGDRDFDWDDIDWCIDGDYWVDGDAPPVDGDADFQPPDGDDPVDGDSILPDGDLLDGDYTDGDQIVDGDEPPNYIYTCDGNNVLRQDPSIGNWEFLYNCEEYYMVCENGACTTPNPGDEDVPNYCSHDLECPAGYACHDELNECRPLECQYHQTCLGQYGNGFTCHSDGLCYLDCLYNEDCQSGYSCVQGICRASNDCNPTIDHLIIAEGDGVIKTGVSKSLSVRAVDIYGNLVNHALAFIWESDSPSVVSVNANGEITGQSANGTATISARISCNSLAVAQVSYTNYTVSSSGLRVIAIDTITGLPVSNATVLAVQGETPYSQTTVNGQATFNNLDCGNTACDVHILHPDYSYVSAFGLQNNDLYFPLQPNRDLSIAAGVKGNLDFEPIPDIIRQDIDSGAAAFSITGDWADIAYEDLLGETVMTRLRLGSVFDDIVPIDSARESYLHDDPMFEQYRALAQPGAKALWGFAGSFSLNDIITIVTSVMGDEFDLILYQQLMSPMLEDYYFDVQPGFDLQPEPRLFDAEDLNGNNSTTDMIPDYAALDDVGGILRAEFVQGQRIALQFGDLPDMQSGCGDSVFAMIAANEAGSGLTPQGFTWGLDDDAEDFNPGDCKVGSENNGVFTLPSSISGSILQPENYTIMGMALSLSGINIEQDQMMASMVIGPGIDLPSFARYVDHSVVFKRFASLPLTAQMPEFLDIPLSAQYDYTNEAHTLQTDAVAGASFYRALLFSEDESSQQRRCWQVYWPADRQSVSFEQPEGAQQRLVDLLGFSSVQALKLTGQVNYQYLMQFNDLNLDQLNHVLQAYSQHPVQD